MSQQGPGLSLFNYQQERRSRWCKEPHDIAADTIALEAQNDDRDRGDHVELALAFLLTLSEFEQ